jgi:hypothetical protein
MNKPDYNFGDLVRVNGYFPRVFEVDGRRIENWQYADEEWSVIVYELFDCATAEWIEAEEGDLTIVAEAVDAESYLAANPAPVEPNQRMMGLDIDLAEFFGGGAMNMAKKEPAKPTARELSGQEAERRKAARKEKAARIDDLLDQRNWYAAALERTNNEEFGDRVAAIDSELAKLAGDGK